jgi:long-subunit fatty acid transport protein
MNSKILMLVLILPLCADQLSAQGTGGVSKRGTTAAPFLSVPQGARALGMGGAFVALADDPSTMYWNPAGIADLPGIQFTFDHTYWIADLAYEYLGATVNMGSAGSLGVNVTASNYGEMKVTTIDQQDGTGEVFTVADLAIGVSYGLRLTEEFSIGFTPKFIYQKIWKMSASAVAMDIGIRYRTPFKGITLGMSVANFGTKMKMAGNSALVVYQQDPSNTGINNRIPAELQTDDWDLPLNFRVGIAYDLPMGDIGKMTFAVDAMHPSDNYECLNVGAEYAFNDVVFVRGGYKSLAQKDSEEGLTAGIGVRQFLVGNFRFSVDYAYQSFARLKNAQKISLGVAF